MTRIEDATLRAAATGVLRSNDRGRVVVAAAPDPRRRCRWHWGTTLTAIGLSRVDLSRAITEVRGLLSTQRPSGMLPLVFDDSAPDLRGHELTSELSALPGQPIAVRAILDRGRDNGGADLAAAEEFVAESFDALLAAHRWFTSVRDPGRTGLVEIVHPWESAFATSLRWDGPLSRSGLHQHAEPAERDRWLLRQLRSTRRPDTAVREADDFRVRDVLLSAVLATSADLMAGLADEVGRTDVTTELKEDAARFREGVAATVDPRTMLARDFDVRAGTWLEPTTVVGFAPLVAGGDAELLAAQRAILLGADWMGHPVLRYPLPPTVSPASPGFRRRELWRGPVWPTMVVLLAWAATRDGAWDLRALLRDATLELLSDHSFAEFYEPITGEPLGARGHSWTAAAALELLG
jgi:hypothetical protein